MTLSADLRQLAGALWEAQRCHPLMLGIGDGTLDPAVFAYWLRQNYRDLIEYSRAFALAAAKAPDLATMGRFAALLTETLGTEMDLHRSYCAEFGITEADLESEPMAPTTQAYTDFLLRTATIDDYVVLVAALLPCMWGYSDLGRWLKERGLPAEERYARWIAMYAFDEFTGLAAWCRELLDQAGASLTATQRAHVEDAFLTSSRYELRFWEMAWTGERW